MIYPELNELLKKTKNRYTLVVEAAKRARQLVDGSRVLTKEEHKNPVTQAVYEIYEDKVTFVTKENTDGPNT